MLEVCKGLGTSVTGNTHPGFDPPPDAERDAAASVDHDPRDGLPSAIVHPVPLASGAGREQDVGAAPALDYIADGRTLLVFENLTLGREDRDDRRGKPRPRQIFAQ